MRGIVLTLVTVTAVLLSFSMTGTADATGCASGGFFAGGQVFSGQAFRGHGFRSRAFQQEFLVTSHFDRAGNRIGVTNFGREVLLRRSNRVRLRDFRGASRFSAFNRANRFSRVNRFNSFSRFQGRRRFGGGVLGGVNNAVNRTFDFLILREIFD